MRNETVNLQTQINELAASDERVASTLLTVVSGVDALSRAIETQREENRRNIDRTADILTGALETVNQELKTLADKLTGRLEPEQETEAPQKQNKLRKVTEALSGDANVTAFPSTAS